MKNENPLFSIIIPTYNHGHLIGRCLNSLLMQTYVNWEAIVVNNFSSDNTVDIVEGFCDCRIRLINNANNGVIAVSRNKGIEAAQGEWICFLDSDDWWTSNKLEYLIPYLNDYDFFYHDFYIVRNVRWKFSEKKVLKGRELSGNKPVDLLLNGNPIINSSVVLRKSIVDKAGFLDEDSALIAVEDFEYWLRVACITSRIKYISNILGYYWIGENTSASLKHAERECALFDKYRGILTDKQWRVASNRLNFNHARLLHRNGYFHKSLKLYLNTIFTIGRGGLKINSIFLIMLSIIHIKR